MVERLKRRPKTDGEAVLFETGYGPSGLPHIGTFGEVARTTMVRHAFRVLTEDRVPTRLIAFSDDMDGLRKVPDNIPNKELVAPHLGKPLTQVPDPFGTHPSFGAHNNARLRAFLDAFGFDYEFVSATECYTSGRFDADAAAPCWSASTQVMAIMLPSLRRGAGAELFAVPADLPAHRRGAAGADRGARRRRPAPSPTTTPRRASASRCRSPAATASCSGSRTGRCAGPPSASTTRWPART